jgi:hypothetical protein
VLEYCADLFKRYTCEPLHELRYLGAVLQILEQRGYRNARATENPSAADTLWITLHRRTRRPVNHVDILPPLLPGREHFGAILDASLPFAVHPGVRGKHE